MVNRLHAQSSDIAMGVDEGEKGEEGAGDQGIMFGYACNETEELMPAPIQFAHRILRLMAEDRKSGRQPVFGPDAKSQVTLAYRDGKPVGSGHRRRLDPAQGRPYPRRYPRTGASPT